MTLADAVAGAPAIVPDAGPRERAPRDAPEGAPDGALWVLEANLDDCPGQLVARAIEAALEAGALDAWAAPLTMKKGRPGVLVGALCEEPRRARGDRRAVRRDDHARHPPPPGGARRARARLEEVETALRAGAGEGRAPRRARGGRPPRVRRLPGRARASGGRRARGDDRRHRRTSRPALSRTVRRPGSPRVLESPSGGARGTQADGTAAELAPPERRGAIARGWLRRAALPSLPIARRGAARGVPHRRDAPSAIIGAGRRARRERRARARPRAGRCYTPRARGSASILPPADGEVPTPTPGVVRSYRTTVAGVPGASTSPPRSPPARAARCSAPRRSPSRSPTRTPPRRARCSPSRASSPRPAPRTRSPPRWRARSSSSSPRARSAFGSSTRRRSRSPRSTRGGRLRPLARGRLALKAVAVERTGLSRGDARAGRGPRRRARRAALRGLRRGDGGAARGRRASSSAS